MNNTDFLINQMNQIQNLANQSLYMTEECSRPMTEAETTILSCIYGFFIILMLIVIVWGFWTTRKGYIIK